MNWLADAFVLVLILGTAASFVIFAVVLGGWWGVALVAVLMALFIGAAWMGHNRRRAGKA